MPATRLRLAVAILSTLLLFSAAGADDNTDRLLENRLKAHINFLADDLLLGRQPGSDGYNIAANYVASQLLQAGLVPAGDKSSFFQQVPLRQALLVPGTAQMQLEQTGQPQDFTFVDQFYMSPSLAHTHSQVEAGMVFVGYGIDAPELEHQDYVNIDAEGKVVVIFSGQPHDFPSEQGAHFASIMEKTKAAVRHGAVGIIIIHTPRAGVMFQWERIKNLVGSPSMGWLDADGEVYGVFEQIKAGAMISHAAAGGFFTNAEIDLPSLIALDDAGEVLPVMPLTGRISMSQQSTHSELTSPNVVAVLPGSDPLLADEYVVYVAHLDHLGELSHAETGETPENGENDHINNGAMDNASGIAVMLETARIFAENPPPRRSVMFLAVTAEEKGLVGSEYFAVNPTVPIDKLVSVVNLDMPVLLYEFADVIAFGAERSTMGDVVREAANSFGIELTPDPFPEQNIFVRSDHYRFVQQGVPSVFLVTGTQSLDDNADTQPIFEGFLRQHYHKPSDDLNLPINYRAGARFTRINVKIGELIANQPQRPDWREGDFFGRTFAK